MKKNLFILLLLPLLVLWQPSAHANEAEFERGLQAFNAKGYKKAFEIWLPLAEQGHAGSQFYLGAMYDSGAGVREDDKEAFKWLRLAADQGYAGAQNDLGFMYLRGHGTRKDDNEAFKWFRLAAEQGDSTAQSNLGAMYLLGQGVPQSDIYAYMWAILAKANGYEKTGKLFDRARKNLIPSQIEEAQDLASRCFESDYRDCGE